jgi:hypothetical protein
MAKNHRFNTFEQAAEYLQEKLDVKHSRADIESYVLDSRLVACFWSDEADKYAYMKARTVGSILRGGEECSLLAYDTAHDVTYGRSEFIGAGWEIITLETLRISSAELDRFIDCGGKPLRSPSMADSLRKEIAAIESLGGKSKNMPEILRLLFDHIRAAYPVVPLFSPGKMPGTVDDFHQFCGKYSEWIRRMSKDTFKDYCKKKIGDKPICTWANQPVSQKKYWLNIEKNLNEI